MSPCATGRLKRFGQYPAEIDVEDLFLLRDLPTRQAPSNAGRRYERSQPAKVMFFGESYIGAYLSRCLVVLIVALAFEGLVATFRALHENLAQLPAAASIVAATGALLASWGIFIRNNRLAEELEPEAIE